MEHLWSQAGATSGNRSQMGRGRKWLKQADRQPVATYGNRFGAHVLKESNDRPGTLEVPAVAFIEHGLDLRLGSRPGHDRADDVSAVLEHRSRDPSRQGSHLLRIARSRVRWRGSRAAFGTLPRATRRELPLRAERERLRLEHKGRPAVLVVPYRAAGTLQPVEQMRGGILAVRGKRGD